MNPENETQQPDTIFSCKDFLSQMGPLPLDELLGSVSYSDIDSVEGKIQQIRTSARVFKKMKFDMSNSIANQEKKAEKKEEPASKPEEVKQENKKICSNSFWNSEEKNMFFEALNEYGKDFESIHMSLSNRLKKKGVPEELIKTKYQIRTFYYRTWHLVAGPCKFSELIPKNAQELYALVNYGEMKRKLGAVTKKNICKLNELMYNGSVAVRIRGKTIRIKTPMCRALRRLNQLDEKYDDLKLPTRVVVELKPKDMDSFVKVQSIAQNPRIKMALPLQKRLTSLITCVSSRWKSSEALVYDKALISTNVTTKDCIPDQKTIEENSSLLTSLLRLSPPSEAHVEIPSVDISEYFTGQSICLNAFEIRKGGKIKEVKKEEKEIADSNIKTEKSPKSVEDDANVKELKSPTVTEVNAEAVNTILSLQTQDLKDNKCDDQNSNNINSNNNNDSDEIMKLKEEKRLRIEQIRQGWTLETSGSLTIGELYLMFGSDSKLSLVYCWESLKIEAGDDRKSQKENYLSQSLKKLLSIAKLQCDNNKNPLIRCTCGHVCGAKNSTQFKKPISTKIPKKSQSCQQDISYSTVSIDSKEDLGTSSNLLPTTKVDHAASSQRLVHNSNMEHLFSQLDTMQRLNPKSRYVRGRPRCKQLVVERKLVPNKSESNHQIVSMNIISQENTCDTVVEQEKHFSGLLLEDHRSSSSMSTGLSTILKETDDPWTNPDVSDYSLSSLLGHLDCPSNSKSTVEDTQLSQDVDSQLRTLLIETSVDYTAKFADLAAQVVDKK